MTSWLYTQLQVQSTRHPTCRLGCSKKASTNHDCPHEDKGTMGCLLHTLRVGSTVDRFPISINFYSLIKPNMRRLYTPGVSALGPRPTREEEVTEDRLQLRNHFILSKDLHSALESHPRQQSLDPRKGGLEMALQVEDRKFERRE